MGLNAHVMTACLRADLVQNGGPFFRVPFRSGAFAQALI